MLSPLKYLFDWPPWLLLKFAQFWSLIWGIMRGPFSVFFPCFCVALNLRPGLVLSRNAQLVAHSPSVILSNVSRSSCRSSFMYFSAPNTFVMMVPCIMPIYLLKQTYCAILPLASLSKLFYTKRSVYIHLSYGNFAPHTWFSVYSSLFASFLAHLFVWLMVATRCTHPPFLCEVLAPRASALRDTYALTAT